MATRPKPSSACAHNVRSAYRSPATALNRPRVRSERVLWHDSQQFTGGYPMAKLRTDVDPSDGASSGMAWPEAEVVDRPRRGPHDT
jgi:hypothetical protein